MEKPESLLITYIYLAIGCIALGIVITFVGIFLVQYFQIDIQQNLWLLAVPVISSLFLNIVFIELYRKFKKRSG